MRMFTLNANVWLSLWLNFMSRFPRFLCPRRSFALIRKSNADVTQIRWFCLHSTTTFAQVHSTFEHWQLSSLFLFGFDRLLGRFFPIRENIDGQIERQFDAKWYALACIQSNLSIQFACNDTIKPYKKYSWFHFVSVSFRLLVASDYKWTRNWFLVFDFKSMENSTTSWIIGLAIKVTSKKMKTTQKKWHKSMPK